MSKREGFTRSSDYGRLESWSRELLLCVKCIIIIIIIIYSL